MRCDRDRSAEQCRHARTLGIHLRPAPAGRPARPRLKSWPRLPSATPRRLITALLDRLDPSSTLWLASTAGVWPAVAAGAPHRSGARQGTAWHGGHARHVRFNFHTRGPFVSSLPMTLAGRRGAGRRGGVDAASHCLMSTVERMGPRGGGAVALRAWRRAVPAASARPRRRGSSGRRRRRGMRRGRVTPLLQIRCRYNRFPPQ